MNRGQGSQRESVGSAPKLKEPAVLGNRGAPKDAPDTSRSIISKTGHQIYRHAQRGAEGENNVRTYCFCKGDICGEMVGCDDAECEREWVPIFSFDVTAQRSLIPLPTSRSFTLGALA